MARTRFLPALLGCACSMLGAVAGSASIDAPDGALAALRPEVFRADMGFLADDLLEGRAPGTRGYAVAAAFVASRLASLGLRPGAGDNRYLQPVPLRSMHVDPAASEFRLKGPHDERPLSQRGEVLLFPDPGRAQIEVDAPLLFVGYGITAPEQHHDDYAHLDVRGKIVVALYGAPAFSDPSVKAHYSAAWVKRAAAAAHGAAGYLALYSEDLQSRFPFAKMVIALDSPRLAWIDAAGRANDYSPSLKCTGFLSIEGAAPVLAGSGHSIGSILADAKAGTVRPFALPARARVRTATRSADIKGTNVVGILEGSDPVLKSEYVVYSAHLDHLGIGVPVEGDAIYNGALDNASGVAALLSVAEAYAHATARPRRSVLFIAVDGEESGLLGSDYFARFPTVPRGSMVANLNIDGGVPLWPIADVTVLGGEHSTLLQPIQAAAAQLHLKISPDAHPEQVYFIRSDQYSFVRQGIPAVYIGEGMTSSDPAIDTEQRMRDWVSTRYHEPSDDMNQPYLNFEAAVQLATVQFLTGWSVANATQRPAFNAGDFFGGQPGKASRARQAR